MCSDSEDQHRDMYARGFAVQTLPLSRLKHFMILLSLSGQIHFRGVIWVTDSSFTTVVAVDVVRGVGLNC